MLTILGVDAHIKHRIQPLWINHPDHKRPHTEFVHDMTVRADVTCHETTLWEVHARPRCEKLVADIDTKATREQGSGELQGSSQGTPG